MSSPVSPEHGTFDGLGVWWLVHYTLHTPGCESGSKVTWMMLESAPQSDAFLMISPDYGGHARDLGRDIGAGLPI